MDESTTTSAPVDDTGAQAQPDDQQTTVAENQPQEQPTDQGQQEGTTEAAQPDDNLAWLQNKGIDPNSPEALAKVAGMYRNAEKQMHSKAAESAQLQQTLSQPPEPANYTDEYGNVDQVAQLQQTVQAMQMKQTVDDFFTTNPDAKAYEEKMTELVTQDPAKIELIKAGYMNVQDLYYMAKGSDAGREANLKADGGREALQKVVDKQQAKAVAGNATSSQMSSGTPTKDNFDSWYSSLTPAERAKPETQEIVASLLS